MATILIVEDDLAIRDSFETLCNKLGWTAVLAGDGQQALELLNHVKPDVILLDMLMPVMGGLEFLEHFGNLKISREDRPSIIVMTNSQVPANSEARVHSLGADEYLPKYKITPDSFSTLISGYLKKTKGKNGKGPDS